MNKATLEQAKNGGPCTCNAVTCEYCSLIGDFKFRWYIANAENAIMRNQLERALEIALGLSEKTNRTECAFDWCAALETLVHEVRGEADPYNTPTKKEDAGEI